MTERHQESQSASIAASFYEDFKKVFTRWYLAHENEVTRDVPGRGVIPFYTGARMKQRGLLAMPHEVGFRYTDSPEERIAILKEVRKIIEGDETLGDSMFEALRPITVMIETASQEVGTPEISEKDPETEAEHAAIAIFSEYRDMIFAAISINPTDPKLPEYVRTKTQPHEIANRGTDFTKENEALLTLIHEKLLRLVSQAYDVDNPKALRGYDNLKREIETVRGRADLPFLTTPRNYAQIKKDMASYAEKDQFTETDNREIVAYAVKAISEGLDPERVIAAIGSKLRLARQESFIYTVFRELAKLVQPKIANPENQDAHPDARRVNHLAAMARGAKDLDPREFRR